MTDIRNKYKFTIRKTDAIVFYLKVVQIQNSSRENSCPVSLEDVSNLSDWYVTVTLDVKPSTVQELMNFLTESDIDCEYEEISDTPDRIKVVEIFHQNYKQSDGIAPHWVCKFFRNGYADYYYFTDYAEADKFAMENGYVP